MDKDKADKIMKETYEANGLFTVLINDKIKKSTLELKGLLPLLTDEVRIKLRDHLFEGYCKTCGAKYLKGNDDCYCWRDE